MQMSLLGSLAASIQHRDGFQEAAAKQLPLVGPSVCPSLALSSPAGFLSSESINTEGFLLQCTAVCCGVLQTTGKICNGRSFAVG